MRRSPFLILISLGIAGFVGPAFSAVPECMTFARLVPAFASDLSLDLKKARIEFVPLNLALDPKTSDRAGYVLIDQKNCSISGDCDSEVYLGDPKGCFHSVLAYRGKWKGLDRKPGRSLASLTVESRFEGDAVKGNSILRIERRLRHFRYDPKADRYEEVK
jgi:hypothetical protein